MPGSATGTAACRRLAAPGATNRRGPWLPPLFPSGSRRPESAIHGHAAIPTTEPSI
jgi:hypothetical protein